METDVQQLLLKIDASTELARRELKKVETDFDSFTRKSESSVGAAEAAFGKLGGAATLAKASIIGFVTGIGIEGVAQFGRAVLQAADSLDAAAEKAGLGVERYQTLKESLRSLEVDGEKVDAIFGRLTDTLGAVQGGTAAGGVEAALDKMGIKARILSGEITTTDQLLEAIAASAKQFGSQAEFTASVIDIVGKKLGVDLANALKDGGTALKAGEQAFRDAGGVVDAEYIKKLADANEAIDRFTSNAKSKLIIWSAETIGFFEAAANAADDFARASLNAFDRAAGVSAPATRAAPSTARGKDDQTLERLRSMGLENSAVFKNLDAEYRRKYGIGSVPLPTDEATITVSASRASSGPARSSSPARSSGGGRSGPAALTPAQIRAGFGDRLSDLPSIGPSVLGDGPLANLGGISEQLQTITTQAVDLSNIDIFSPETLAVGDALLQDLSFGLTNAIAFSDNLGDALVQTFERAGLAMIQSGILNFLSGGKEGVSFGDLFKSVGAIFGGARAEGGPVMGGRAYLVGERGPEIMVPGMNGAIIPNHALRAGSARGGGGTVQNFDLRGAVVTEQLYRQMQAIGVQAAQAGAVGGARMAGADSARRARRTAR